MKLKRAVFDFGELSVHFTDGRVEVHKWLVRDPIFVIPKGHRYRPCVTHCREILKSAQGKPVEKPPQAKRRARTIAPVKQPQRSGLKIFSEKPSDS